MITEVASAGFYVPEPFPNKKCPRLQILTIKNILENGKKIEYYELGKTALIKKAERKKKGPKQLKLSLIGDTNGLDKK